ncbi:MAG: Gfo/Idh/MocA family oxidoreductase [Colwellia sp.]
MNYVLIGTGNISNTYLAAVTMINNSQIVACVSRSGSSPSDMPALPSFKSLNQVNVDFDAVIVTTPNGLHYHSAIEAAKLGKHVLTEKVLAINTAQAEEMIKVCNHAHIKLAVCFQRRTSPDNQAIKKLINENAFGQLFSADLSAKFYRPQSYYDSGAYRGGWSIDGGGPFIQQAAHNIDIFTWFFGQPRRIQAEMANFSHDIEAEDHGAALLRYSEHGGSTDSSINNANMIATITASTATQPGFAARLEVHCEKGSFTLLDDKISQWDINGIDDPRDNSFTYRHNGATSASVDDASAHVAIINNFEQAIINGAELIASGESAAQTTALISNIYRSSTQ